MERGGRMKRHLGMLALCALLLLPDEAQAAKLLFQEAREEFDVPNISEEMEALTGTRQMGERREKDLFYRLLKKDAALSDYGEASLDAVYDPRTFGRVTPVRSQSANTCWAFSSFAAGEQSLISKGLASPETMDFSEAHFTYFFYHPVTDPLGNTAGDGNYNISAWNDLEVGSNTIFSTFSLAGWVGAADEAAAPYESFSERTVYPDTMAYEDVAHLQNAYWINFRDVDAVHVTKQMIQKYGAAAINLYWNYRYYQEDSHAYYFPLDSSQANNHSVTIVGWDDTFPREKFGEAHRPSGDGAWIVKNSYGESFGDGGYFYLSYEDSAVNSGNTSSNRARAYIFDFEPADNYDFNYQYDGSAGAYNATNPDSALTKIDSGASIANVFAVHKKEGCSAEALKAVSFALFDTAVSYSIQIYKNPVDPGNPASGEPQLAAPATGSTSYAGYYTIPLSSSVALKDGETFSVVITLEKESGEQVDFFVDKTYQNGGWISFVNAVEAGQSFRFTDGGWEDMAANGITARIKAFTDGTRGAPPEEAPVQSTGRTGAADAELSGALDAGKAAVQKKIGEYVSEEKKADGGQPSVTSASPAGVTPAQPNGMSQASPTKSADTYDASGGRLAFWGLAFGAGLLLAFLGRRGDSGQKSLRK